MRIVLLAFEVDSFAIGVIAQKLTKLGHQVWIVNGDQWCFIYDWGVEDWYTSLGITTFFTLEEEYEKLYRSRYVNDWEYLRCFEQKYCVTKNIQQLMLSGHIINSSCRFPYYTPSSRELMYFWVELQLRWAESIFEEIKPDFVFSMFNNYFIKNVFWQMALASQVRMKTLVGARLDDFCILSDSFGCGTGEELRRAIIEFGESDVTAAHSYVDDYAQGDSFTTYSNCPTEDSTKLSFSSVVHELYTALRIEFLDQFVHKRVKNYRGWWRGNIMASSHLLRPFYYVRRAVNQFRYLMHLGFPFEIDLPRGPYVYMPLHVLPESTTLTMSKEYYEADQIRFLSKELPVGMFLVVKENPMMIGDRPYEFYTQFHELPNVVLLDPLYSSRKVLLSARGVVGVSGTVLLEAAMMRKPTLAFGQPEFLDVVDFHGYSDAPKFMQHCNSEESSTKYNVLLRYIQYVLKSGISVSRRTLLYGQRDADFYSGIEVVLDALAQDLM